MQVKIDLNRFEGHAELTGAELDALTKILSKFFGTDQHFVNSRYVQVRNGEKIKAKIEISVDAEFVTRAAYDAEAAAENAENARIAEEQRVARQVKAENVILDHDGAREALISLLEEQGLLYWHERPAQNPITGWSYEKGVVEFWAGKPDAVRRIVVDAEGNVRRLD